MPVKYQQKGRKERRRKGEEERWKEGKEGNLKGKERKKGKERDM